MCAAEFCFLSIQASVSLTRITTIGIRIRMSALTYALNSKVAQTLPLGKK